MGRVGGRLRFQNVCGSLSRNDVVFVMIVLQILWHKIDSFSVTRSSPVFRRPPLQSSHSSNVVDGVVQNNESVGESTARRAFVRDVLTSGLCAGVVAPATTSALAASSDNAQTSRDGLVSRDELADLLRAVPTFCIVDKGGVPFMVVGEDAKVTGYFFTSYTEARRILKLASYSADRAIREAKQEGETDADELLNPWSKARVSTVPLDIAVTLALKSGSGNIRNYFQVAASSADIEDALAVSGKEDLAEGKVPLFYYKDYTIGESKNSPLFFSKKQLQDSYRKANPGGVPPETAVTELFAVLTEMVKPGGSDTDLKTLVFVPPDDSSRRIEECKRIGGSEPPFLLGQRNIVL